MDGVRFGFDWLISYGFLEFVYFRFCYWRRCEVGFVFS